MWCKTGPIVWNPKLLSIMIVAVLSLSTTVQLPVLRHLQWKWIEFCENWNPTFETVAAVGYVSGLNSYNLCADVLLLYTSLSFFFSLWSPSLLWSSGTLNSTIPYHTFTGLILVGRQASGQWKLDVGVLAVVIWLELVACDLHMFESSNCHWCWL